MMVLVSVFLGVFGLLLVLFPRSTGWDMPGGYYRERPEPREWVYGYRRAAGVFLMVFALVIAVLLASERS